MRADASANDPNQPVAIVGIGCRFPGGVDGPDAFWRLLRDGVDAVGEIPPDRMDVERLYDARPATPGRIMSRRGGYLSRLAEFDAEFFGISPREAERLDPQQRLLLETTWEALEDAGLDAHALSGTATGVFVGQWLSDFEARMFAEPAGVDFHMTTGSGRYAASGRLSYTFGFTGPSLTIDTACSSSLAAVLLACRSIRAGESSMAVAAGVNVILQPQITIAYSQSRMMAPDGHCKFGDARGDGYVRSEGCGVVALRPLADAVAAGDRIYAVIRGGALNNDGRTSGSLGTPSREGQRSLLRRAYADAGVAPARVRYVEAHGTGTRAGDPVELDALGVVLGEDRRDGARCLVGSVKTNIGHTEGAAGIAGLIKCALALHHDAVPASLHHEQPNPSIPWATLPFDVPRATSSWPAGDGPRVAGVSAFGIAGSNAHVVLEQSPADAAAARAGAARRMRIVAPRAHALALSARAPGALAALAGAYADRLDAPDAPAIGDLCASAAMLRTPLAHRAVFVAEDAASLTDRLRRFAAGEREAAQVVGEALNPEPRRVAFVFPGQGSQWVGMARELSAREPAFRDAIDGCERAMAPFVDWSLHEQLHADADSAAFRMDDIAVIQPALLAVEIALAALWRAWGVEPAAVVGHSLGEVGAAYVAGALSLGDAMRVICRRSALMRGVRGHGAMAVVELSAEETEARLAPWPERLSVAVSNAPRSTVVSGEPAALLELLAALEAEGVFCRQVKVDVASHSAQMAPLVPELVAELSAIAPRAGGIAMYSTVTGGAIAGDALDAGYWGRNLREPVQFARTVAALAADGIDCVVELSAHPMLRAAVEQCYAAAGRDVLATGSLRRGEPEQAAMLTALGTLWTSGQPAAWAKVMPREWARVALPTYQWQRERHWHPAADGVTGSARAAVATARPSDESLGWLYTMRWQAAPMRAEAAARTAAASRWVVIGPDAAERDAVAAALRGCGHLASAASPDTILSALETPADPSAATMPARIVMLAEDSPDAPFAPLAIAQTLLPHRWSVPPRIWFVTRGAQSIEPTERASPWQGALWGSARVLAEEHPELWGGLIDLGHDVADADAMALAHALIDSDGEDQVALRHGERFVLRLESLNASQPSVAGPAWRADAAYLVTGGLGDIGLRIASALVDAGVRRLVLLGRTGLPPRTQWASLAPDSVDGGRAEAVRALEAKGAAVHLLTADVGDEAQLAAALAAYAAESWPPIVGVIHAAGLLDNRLAGEMDRATFDRAVVPKLHGALHLDRLIPTAELFVMFSSTGGFLAQPGQANYAAANAGLDALALDRRARGRHALSIAWGVWSETGLVRGAAAARNVEELRRQGIRPFPPADGVALFFSLLRSAEPAVAVLPADWSVFRQARGGRDTPLFRAQLQRASAAGSASDPSDLATRLSGARSAAERRRIVDATLREAAAGVLRIPPSRLDARRPLGSVGLDSLMALELRNRLEALFARPLPATLLWNYPTLDALAAHLGDAADATSAPPEESAPVPAPAPGASAADVEVDAGLSALLGDLAGMSDDDAARALRGGR